MWFIVTLFIFFIWCVVSPFIPKTKTIVMYVPTPKTPTPQVTYNITINNYNTYVNRAQSQIEPKYVYSEEGLFRN